MRYVTGVIAPELTPEGPPPPPARDGLPATATQTLADGLAGLRATVTAYVDRRRGEGAPVQRVLPEVKTLTRTAAGRDLEYEAATALLDQVVRWSIEAYYAPSAR